MIRIGTIYKGAGTILNWQDPRMKCFVMWFLWTQVNCYWGQLWQYERRVVHDGLNNTYTITKNGKNIILAPLKTRRPPSRPEDRFAFGD